MFTALLGSTRLGSTLNKPLAQAELGSKGARIFWPEAQLQNLGWAKLDPSSKQAWTKLEISSSNTLNSCYFGPFPVRFKLEQCLKHIWMKLETCLNKAWTKLEPSLNQALRKKVTTVVLIIQTHIFFSLSWQLSYSFAFQLWVANKLYCCW